MVYILTFSCPLKIKHDLSGQPNRFGNNCKMHFVICEGTIEGAQIDCTVDTILSIHDRTKAVVNNVARVGQSGTIGTSWIC